MQPFLMLLVLCVLGLAKTDLSSIVKNEFLGGYINGAIYGDYTPLVSLIAAANEDDSSAINPTNLYLYYTMMNNLGINNKKSHNSILRMMNSMKKLDDTNTKRDSTNDDESISKKDLQKVIRKEILRLFMLQSVLPQHSNKKQNIFPNLFGKTENNKHFKNAFGNKLDFSRPKSKYESRPFIRDLNAAADSANEEYNDYYQ
ncbi:hypothetical protein TRFO_04145 [Tritrichomonas foetus]|uniref:Uncharacterized protein n=1 Tax=Tritrichomonas foetus TaxID=1144522 RepID=A0A1J4KMP1_9EUKA|nr:hypothetical protein TRFO_04145 [Tritrichomonas foetus]|eukprot:OHT10645.1 hypothetical protein TRFO_04145 [Tritrichomonas foetus]